MRRSFRTSSCTPCYAPCRDYCPAPYDNKDFKELLLPNNTKVVVFSSDEKNFCVTASLVIRNNNALLIDTKFNKTDPRKILYYLQYTGLRLTDIFISHGDPDYYFGLEEIKAAYPKVIARTTPSVAQHITNTVWNKLVVWKDALQDEIPRNIVLPEILTDNSFTFEGLHFNIFGSDRSRIALYCPELRLVAGGPSIVSGNHLFLADMSTDEDRTRWHRNLVELRTLNPAVVIPGHSDLEKEIFDVQSIAFSIEYLFNVASILPTTPTSDLFISRMLEKYPNLKSYDVLALSAKVLTGEMPWT